MHRIIVEWGPVTLYWYGLLLAIGFVAGLELLLFEGRRRGLDENKLFNMTLLIMIGSLAGARLLYVGAHWESFSGDIIGVFRIWEGGLVKYGGIVVGVVVAIVYTRIFSLPGLSVFDAGAPSLALGAAITRAGCFLNGCCFGTPTDLPWGVVFPRGSFPDYVFPNARVHPTQIYSGLLELIMFGILWGLRKRIGTPGRLFCLYLMMEGASRLLLDEVGYQEPMELLPVFGLSMAVSQILSLVTIVVGVVAWVVLGRRVKRSELENLG